MMVNRKKKMKTGEGVRGEEGKKQHFKIVESLKCLKMRKFSVERFPKS